MREMPSAERMYLERNDAYAQRDELVNLVAKMANALGWLTWMGFDASAESGWRNVVFICLPSGQVSWHITDEEANKKFDWLPRMEKGSTFFPEWDGHDTETKRSRIRDMRADLVTVQLAKAWNMGRAAAMESADWSLQEFGPQEIGDRYKIVFREVQNPHRSASGLPFASE